MMHERLRLPLVLAAAALVSLTPFLVVGELPGDRWLSARDEHAGAFAALGVSLLAADVLIPVPSSVLGSLLAARLGVVAGFACIWGGLLVGNLAGYGMGRLALARLGASLPVEPASVLLFATRPVPVAAEVLSFVAGASRMPLRSFARAVVPGNALYAAALAAGGASLAAQRWSVALAIALGLPALGWLFWRKLGTTPAGACRKQP